jgi:hypothetical protein
LIVLPVTGGREVLVGEPAVLSEESSDVPEER